MTPQALAQVDRIITLMMELHRLLRRHAEANAKGQFPMNWPQLHALMLIREHEGMTMKELAKALKITAPSATAFVERLVALRWVERGSDTTNRKLVRIRVTARGKRVLADAMQQKKRVLRQVFGLMQTKDQSAFARILQDLCRVLDEQSPVSRTRHAAH